MEGLAAGAAVLIRGEDDEVALRGDGGGGEGPFGEVAAVIGEVPAGEIDRGGVRVVDFDPVGSVTVLVLEAVLVTGEEFADIGSCLQGEERCDEQRGDELGQHGFWGAGSRGN